MTRRRTALHPAVTRSTLARSLDRALLSLLVAGVLFALLQFALIPYGSPEAPILLLFPVDLLIYLAAGLLAWYRRPSNRLGPLILAAGGSVFLSGIGTTLPPLVPIAAVAATLPLALVVHLLHAFPSGRIRGRVSRTTVAAAYVTALLLQAPAYLFDPTGPAPQLSVADVPWGVAAGSAVQGIAGVAIMITTAVVLAHRLLVAHRDQRRVLVPLYGYGIVTVLFLPLSTHLLAPAFGLPSAIVGGLQLFAVTLVPIAIALGMLRGGFARTGELEELGTWLGASGAERPALTAALTSTLGDPSLEVWFWMPQRETYVDVQGDPVAEPSASARRGIEVVELDGRRIGAIVYDANIVGEAELVRTAGRVLAIALDRERLTAELMASRRALQFSRERLVGAADSERRRIAQDLHDSLQMQLVLLALEAQQLAKGADPSGAMAERATELRKGIDAAAAELRQIVHAVMPAALVERGLAAAVQDLADRMPIPTFVELESRTLPPAVESTAYFVVAEALTNAVKHSEATRISVRLAHRNDVLHVGVRDDGVGGALLNRGAGLRGIADRVDVLEGSITIESPPGGGTDIHAEVPCVL
ncbi:sensor histidine kinase [Humibacter sp.]|uniref:sensor histidine kinase n=1 Tax=Humibacter sp. TaxID=1940291 RepID=UPI002D125D98|nr:histidine kinase [Humibacter sp.]HVX09138.1 histidine kinase [Humibacter sp.]